MPTAIIRKIVVTVEETCRELDREILPPSRKAVACAVIKNPCAGAVATDLEPLMVIGAELGKLLGERAVAALGVKPDEITSYGKSAIVGQNGELEHAAALLHPTLGKPLREAVKEGKAIIPSSKKRGGPGTEIDVPLHNKNDEWDFDYFDAAQARVSDAPGADEVVVAVAVTDGGRVLARIRSKPKAEVGAG
ncbi:MAG: amino acid synthesis family protein [Rhodospirillales bacterium]|jgi:hypothetical protein|nr:peptide synthetase [Rhodospirillaceae bacterium]MDP6430432.1 amino acid synthesis family protein [Rhodospirillales bacterium]MDP6642888.1 amino acid synthesis family protein [Rhodospirillales bacterium]MDP6841983.1 amino acid synthesis family protein [Rhodospirillales bacterium]